MKLALQCCKRERDRRRVFKLTRTMGTLSNHDMSDRNVKILQIQCFARVFFFHFCILHSCRCPLFIDVKWLVLQLCGRRGHLTTSFHFFISTTKPLITIYSRVVQHILQRSQTAWSNREIISLIVSARFLRQMAPDNRETKADLRNYFFRWCSRCRRQ